MHSQTSRPKPQPQKAGLEEQIKVDVSGDTLGEPMNNPVDAVICPSKVQFNQKK